jgi:hypothetical protein
MGLDIRAYRRLQFAPAGQLRDDSSLYLREALAYTNKAFPGRADGLHPEMAYSSCEDSFAFQAGSYMYYSKWRNQLAEMAGLGSAEAVRTNPEKKGLPFVELIDFSDCEGLIGPKVAAKLAKDFADYEFSASAFAVESEDDFFLALYREWRRAFEWAADGGMVYFG